ncbi:unnamed protein product [Closterium sp. NIES-54]
MSGSPRSNNGSSVTSPSRPTASPAADNSHLQQQQQQYQQQPMYGMPLSNQPNPVVVTVPNNQRLTAHWMGSIVLDSVEEDFSLHLNEVLLVPRLGFNLMSSTQLMKNGITLLGEHGKFSLKYGDKKLGTAVEQNGVFVLNFIPERTTADSDNILSLGPWEHRDDIDYTDDTVPHEGVVPTSSTTAAAFMLTFDDQGLNDVQSSREYMAAVAGWGDPTNMPTDAGIWGAAEPDETTWGETPAERDARLLVEADGELVLAPGEYVDVEVRVPPPNLTRYVAPAFDQIRFDGHQLLLSFFANAEYYLRAQGHKATGETWHKRLGHPSQSMLNNTIKAVVPDKNSLLLPSGLELKPVNRPAPCTICPAANLPHELFPTHFPGAEDYRLMDKVYSDILNLPADGFNGERYVITFTEASTHYVWTRNMTNHFLAFTAFRTWLPLAERESDTKLKAFHCDGAGEYRSNEFRTYLQERKIRRLFSLPHAHQQSGVAERLNRTLQEKMRALLAQAQLGPLYWPFAMDHATVLHNLLSSSALPNNASPYLLWTGKLGTTKLLRVFGCVVQYRPPTAPLGKFDQRAKWGLHLGIEKQCLAWRIMDYRSRLLVPARDCIFYENLTLPVFEQLLATQQNPATLFHGVRSFASADAELAASEEPDPDGAREAAPDPPVPVTSSGIPEFIPLADAAPEDVRDVHHTYLVDEQRQPMPVVSDSSIRVHPDEIGGASGDQNVSVNFTGRIDDNPHYQTGMQILGLAAVVQHSSTVNLEPKTARQALSGPHREKWREAMDRELAALEKRETWDLRPIEKTVNKNVLTGKWVFRVKTKADGTYEKHKARWVVRGFDQTHGIDYTLTFAPVSRHTSVRLVLCEAAVKNFPLRQIDVSNAFLYADVDAQNYVEYPHTYPTNPPSVGKLKKSLYGIKQAPRLWQQHLNRKLTEVGFRQLPHDPGMYRLDDKGSYALLVAYVDDILYVSSSTSLGDRIEADLKKSLDLTISTKVTQFLGLNVSRNSSAIHLTASKYAESLAKRFNISTDFVATPYRSTLTGHVPNLKNLSAAGLQLYQQQLGCLLFAAVTCRPDLAYVASHLAQFLRYPKEEHSLDLQRALRYFVSTPTIGLIFNAGKPTDKMYLSGYVDADHAGDTSTRSSSVSTSTAEAEIYAGAMAAQELRWLTFLLTGLGERPSSAPTLFTDNNATILLCREPRLESRVKHINVRYAFACVASGLWAGLLIGFVTEYFTSNAYVPVQDVADSCRTGAATNIIFGLALGYKSVIIPVFAIAAAIYVSFQFAGMYGIALAALGMLSTLATGLAIDAYGPISDNAGGIAEMAGMGEEIRERTDALDAAGNTTAAIGKGFAIGSAALVSLALFGAYVSRAKVMVVNVTEPQAFVGLLVGAMLPYWFSAMTMKSVGKAALAMVEEVRRQFNTMPGLMEGTTKPDYKKCVEISTAASLREMIPPGALVMLSPVIAGTLFGTTTLAGMLAGALVSGVQIAISASNTGGAWDNAKKYIEAGNSAHAKSLGPKGSDPHKAAVIGDTVGDPLKDTSGPSLNILIKLMAVESLVFAPFFATHGGIIWGGK